MTKQQLLSLQHIFPFLQSFGCFLTPGMNIRLVGEANDYVGKMNITKRLDMSRFSARLIPTLKGFLKEPKDAIQRNFVCGKNVMIEMSIHSAYVQSEYHRSSFILRINIFSAHHIIRIRTKTLVQAT
ncbi:Ferredoxin-dependent glutamate synthase [Trifolium repens]|nr:Ferredoxin-dependent glutamate synthase [Trifolium repens]